MLIQSLGGWLPLAVTLAALGFSYSYARRRQTYQPADPSNERTDRIWHSASVFTIAQTAPGVILGVIGVVPSLVGLALLTLVLLGGLAVLFIMILDLAVVKPLNAKRTHGWLILAPLLFATSVLAVLAAILLPRWPAGAPLPLYDLLSLGGSAAAAGIWWWAYLPLDKEELPNVFR